MNATTDRLLADWEADPDSVEFGRRATKAILADLAAVAPGRSVELRVPPHGAVQLVAGPAHRRGTPKATVEMSPQTLADLARGRTTWTEAIGRGVVLASGERTDLSGLFPL